MQVDNEAKKESKTNVPLEVAAPEGDSPSATAPISKENALAAVSSDVVPTPTVSASELLDVFSILIYCYTALRMPKKFKKN